MAAVSGSSGYLCSSSVGGVYDGKHGMSKQSTTVAKKACVHQNSFVETLTSQRRWRCCDCGMILRSASLSLATHCVHPKTQRIDVDRKHWGSAEEGIDSIVCGVCLTTICEVPVYERVYGLDPVKDSPMKMMRTQSIVPNGLIPASNRNLFH
jgi:hypothetical protein